MSDFQEHLFSGSLMNIAGWVVALFSVLAAVIVSVFLPTKIVIAFNVARREPQTREGELSESQVDNWLTGIRTKYARDNLKSSVKNADRPER